LVGRAVYLVLAKLPVDACGQQRCGDAVYYVAQGLRLADGQGFEDPAAPGTPAADHPPVTALLLVPAGLFRGAHVTLGRLTMALVGTAVIVLAGYLGRRLAGDGAGLAVAALAAVNPNLWMNDVLPMSEAPAALAVLAILMCLYRLLERVDLRRALALGVVLGLAVLTRGELALMVPVAVVPSLVLARGPTPLGRRLVLGAVAALVGVAVVAPWTVWNLTRFEEPVLLSTNEGLTVAGANCDEVYHGGGTGFWNLGCARRIAATLPPDADQSERSAHLRDEGLAYLVDNRGELPRVMAVRLGRVWGIYHPDQMVWLNQGEGRERWASWAGVWAFWLLTPPAVAGAVVLARRDVPVWPLLSTVVVVSVTAAAFYGIVRFRIPADVAQTVLAGVALATGVRAWRARSSPGVPGG
jgi:4-amino-4-deoxy-L-arabinose transferase-like glycosyltransferase